MKNTLHFQLLAAHTLFQKNFLKRIKKIYPDLSPGQPKVIDYLVYHGSACQREIAEECLLEPPTLTLILEKMETGDLVTREKRPDNRKNSIVSLTEKGREIGQTLQRVFAELEDDFCRDLGEEDRTDLSRLLKTAACRGRELLS